MEPWGLAPRAFSGVKNLNVTPLMSLCSLFLYHSIPCAPRKREIDEDPVLWSLQSEKSSMHEEDWQNNSWSAAGARIAKVRSRGGTGGRVAYGKQTAALSVVSWQHEKMYHTNRSILMLSGGETEEHLWKDIYCVWRQRSLWKHAFVQILQLHCGELKAAFWHFDVWINMY